MNEDNSNIFGQLVK
jgi:hypothetical protein